MKFLYRSVGNDDFKFQSFVLKFVFLCLIASVKVKNKQKIIHLSLLTSEICHFTIFFKLNSFDFILLWKVSCFQNRFSRFPLFDTFAIRCFQYLLIFFCETEYRVWVWIRFSSFMNSGLFSENEFSENISRKIAIQIPLFQLIYDFNRCQKSILRFSGSFKIST